jgi:hypothetical protein
MVVFASELFLVTAALILEQLYWKKNSDSLGTL